MTPATAGAATGAARGLDAVNFLAAAMQTAFGAFVTVKLTAGGWAADAVGFALTLSTLASLFTQVPAGAFIDALPDKRRALGIGIVAVAVAALLLTASAHRIAVYAAQMLQGAGSSLISPSIAAISLALVGHDALSERLGRNGRFSSLGNGITAGVMGFFGSFFAPEAVFILAALLAIPALYALTRIGVQAPVDPTPEEAEKRFTWRGMAVLFTDRRLLVFGACTMLFFAANAALLPGVAMLVTRRHPELATLIVAATILLPQGVVAAISPWIGRTAERAGRRPLLLLGWSLVPVQALLYALWPGPETLLLCQLLNGLSGAVFGIMLSLVAADLTRGTGRFNLALGALGVAMAIGASVSTLLAGVVATWMGGQAAYLSLALIGLAGVALLFLAMPETRRATVRQAA